MNPSDWPAHYDLCLKLDIVMERISAEHPDIFRDAAFASFRKTLDAEMKRLKAGGLGVHTKQAEPITPDEEELLWSKNLLGAHSPQTLLDTLVHLCGMYFALRNVKEHRDLKLQSLLQVTFRTLCGQSCFLFFLTILAFECDLL